MKTQSILRCLGWRCDERGIVLAIALVIMALLAGVSATSLYSGSLNAITASNLRMSARAKATAEAGINEALYRLSRQVGQTGAIVPDLTEAYWNNATWQVEIDYVSDLNYRDDGVVGTVLPSSAWPPHKPDQPVRMRYKRPDPVAKPTEVLFYDRDPDKTANPWTIIPLPAAAGTIPITAHPVIEIAATGMDNRGAERQIVAEVTAASYFIPPAPLSSGINVALGGASFIDGVNHSPHIDFNAATMYGDDQSETTDELIDANPAWLVNSPDSNGSTGTCLTLANPTVPPSSNNSCPRLFNLWVREPTSMTAAFLTNNSSILPETAWEGLVWIRDPDHASVNCRATLGHPVEPHWHGVNPGYASAVALSADPTVTGGPAPTGFWRRGVFSWRTNNLGGLGAIPPVDTTTNCNPTDGSPPALVCRPEVLAVFPTFQQFLGLDDVAFQQLLNRADTKNADLAAGQPPLGFTYLQGDFTFNNSTASPTTNDFGLIYVTGDLRISGNQVFKGLIYVDGSLRITGNPKILGAIMVKGETEIDTTGTGNMTLLYSRRAAELGIQSAHPWRVVTWADQAMNN